VASSGARRWGPRRIRWRLGAAAPSCRAQRLDDGTDLVEIPGTWGTISEAWCAMEQRVCGGLSKDGVKRGYERREAHVAGRGRWHAVASSAGRVVASSDWATTASSHVHGCALAGTRSHGPSWVAGKRTFLMSKILQLLQFDILKHTEKLYFLYQFQNPTWLQVINSRPNSNLNLPWILKEFKPFWKSLINSLKFHLHLLQLNMNLHGLTCIQILEVPLWVAKSSFHTLSELTT
jgi:hypothetical protein